MRIEKALKLINLMSVEALGNLTRDHIMFIVSGMDGEDRSRFFIEKNIKVFGGINGYVDDFLKKTNISSLNLSGKTGARAMMQRIQTYPGISEENKKRLQNAIDKTLNRISAPAAGGRNRKSLKKTLRRKNRGLKTTRVRR
jgi:hypothetical protein